MNNSKMLRRARVSTSGVFFANGAVLAIWATNIPGMKQSLGLTDSELGFALSAFAAGTMLMMCIAGAIATRLGSRMTMMVGGILVSAVLPLCSIATSAIGLAVAIFCLGVANSILDVAMNTHGSLIEAKKNRPLMSSFHAVFSIGGLAGASTVATMLSGTLGFMECMWVSGALMLLTTLLTARWMGDLKPEVRAPFESRRRVRHFAWPNRALLVIASLTFLSLFVERTVIDWSSLYLTDVSHTSASIAAFAFGAFSFAMAIGRLGGDYMIRKIGGNGVMAFSGIVGSCGIALAMLVPDPVMSITGFILVGIGLANMTPLLYSQASRAYPGAPGLGLAMNGTLGYIGFLLAPPIIGHLAESYGLKLSMVIPFVAFVLLTVSHFRRHKSAGVLCPEAQIAR